MMKFFTLTALLFAGCDEEPIVGTYESVVVEQESFSCIDADDSILSIPARSDFIGVSVSLCGDAAGQPTYDGYDTYCRQETYTMVYGEDTALLVGCWDSSEEARVTWQVGQSADLR
jgi:hypothetical protein